MNELRIWGVLMITITTTDPVSLGSTPDDASSSRQTHAMSRSRHFRRRQPVFAFLGVWFAQPE